ncbi:thiamine pyrophosphate-binding protein [Scytonema sp. NUACC26]|uniref:thiamine pyrophosphate-binding protein n=1 Tax=Scytonema sp. NUACC26 TaxID=3140176 RepID=UPI0034DC60C1
MTAQPLSQIKLPSNNQSEQKTLADLIVDSLEELGVEYVFGIPGGHNSALFEALARAERRGGIRAILTCHETGAAFMAHGYARETGKIGVCCATTGPGATNLMTGVASAYADGVPVLAITAQTLLSHFSWGAFQESSPDTIDTVAMFDRCTRYNTLVTHPNQLARKLFAALTTALRSPQGPAHLSIPVDLLRSPAPESISYPHLSQLLTQPSSFVDLAALEELWQALYGVLSRGRKVVLLVGQDCGGASQEITTFAELTNTLIVTTQGGKSCIDPYHSLARGVFGFAGHKTAREALSDESVDLILAVGTTLGHWATSQWDKVLLNDKLVHIHPANIYFTRSPMARLHVQGTIKRVFQELVARLETMQQNGKLYLDTSVSLSVSSKLSLSDRHKPPQIEVKEPESYQPSETDSFVKPQRLISLLLQHFPKETRFTVDIGNWLSWSIHYLFPPCPENYRLSIGTASMGWGIGSAIGTALGAPKTPVVCLTGDGCFLMHGNELAVAVSQQLPVIFVILNDRSYGMVKHRHRQTGKEPLEFALPSVDFSLIARAMGANGHTIRHSQDLEQLDYQAIYTHPGPTVLDVHIDSEQVPPMGMY